MSASVNAGLKSVLVHTARADEGNRHHRGGSLPKEAEGSQLVIPIM